jgi:ribosomal-protein-alanine N-acetyltransferase
MLFSPMCAEDLDAVMEIERRSFAQPWSRGMFLHELKVPFSKTILARSSPGAPEVLGYICRWLVGEEVQILNLAVHPDQRRRGIARALVDRIVQEAEQHEVKVITLEVRRENASAITLYAALAFSERGVRRNYYGPGQDAIIMSRTLRAGAADSSVADPSRCVP